MLAIALVLGASASNYASTSYVLVHTKRNVQNLLGHTV